MTNEVDPFKEFEFPSEIPKRLSKFAFFKKVFSKLNRTIKIVAPASAILSLIAVSVTWLPKVNLFEGSLLPWKMICD